MDNNLNNAGKLKKANLGFWAVFFMVFCAVSSGAYGIEESIPVVGPGLILILLIVLPFIYAYPLAMVSAELGSAIPEEGGFYKWIQRGMGEYWGFLAGWWRALTQYIDTSLYVVLSVGYLDTFIPLSPVTEWVAKIALIVAIAYINLRGAKEVAIVSTIFSILIILVFVAITVLGFANWNFDANPFDPILPPEGSFITSLGFGLALGVWFYSGVNSISTITGELQDPQIMPKVIVRAIPALSLLYFLPTLAGLGSVGNWELWGTEINFVNIAVLANNEIISIIFVVAALTANVSLYNIGVTQGSRVFFVLGDDNLCPKWFTHVNKKWGTPDHAIIAVAILSLILSIFDFGQILVVVAFLGAMTFFMVFLAAWSLRKKEPDLERPFKIKLGYKGLILFSIPAMLVIVISVMTNSPDALCLGLVGAISGPVMYFICKRKYGGLTVNDPANNKINPKTGLAFGDIKRMVKTAVVFSAYSFGAHLFLRIAGDTSIYTTALLYAGIGLAVIAIIIYSISTKVDKTEEV